MRQTKIILDEDFSIESDTSSWTLVFDKITGKDEKTGKDKRRYETWYYPTLETGLMAYMDMRIKDKIKPGSDLKAVLSAIKDMEVGIHASLIKHEGEIAGIGKLISSLEKGAQTATDA